MERNINLLIQQDVADLFTACPLSIANTDITVNRKMPQQMQHKPICQLYRDNSLQQQCPITTASRNVQLQDSCVTSKY